MALLQAGVIGTARFESFLRRLFSVKGVVAPQIDPKLSAGLDLLRPPWELGEAALLAGWRGYELVMNPAAVAAQYCWGQIIPPATAGGGIIAVVESFMLYGGIGATTYVTAGIRDARSAGGAAITNIGNIDSRYGSLAGTLPRPACLATQGSDVAVPGVYSRIHVQVTASQDTYVAGPWVLRAGDAGVRTFQILALNVNNQFQATVRWWERVAEPSELAIQ